MSVINITNINILNNPVHFLESYQLEITFECLSELKDDLEFRLIYVSSADDKQLDQELDSLLVGPIPVGVNKFIFEADPPSIEKIPKEELLGVTVILLTCSYKGKEFVRVGYYVNNEYQDEELRESPPEKPVIEKIYRNILDKKPRVTRFPINWENPEEEDRPPPMVEEGMQVDKDGVMALAGQAGTSRASGEGEYDDDGLDEAGDETEEEVSEEDDSASKIYDLESEKDNDDEDDEDAAKVTAPAITSA
ncbi:Histone chaperone asf1 [Spiromyces aspiralis]|uniref:Histone chaperone asf1 n=1 Tax=Spiromyces aspiralis TaxID=68401 RepID=A0ACC1HHX4_9FUNG|nr:Histone chaperone asf1 [Spiromyces aspiralis]